MNHHLHNQLAAARVDELARRAAQQRPIAPSHRHVGRLPAWSAFILVAAIVGLALFASAAPSPLYADYAARWHFSTPMLTVVFATYAVGALSALLLVGRLSDDLGRRPLLAAGLVGLLVAALLFARARSVEWLLAARLVQGVATGTILSAAGAALLELEPGRDIGRAGLVNGVSASLGIGAGALVASLLVQDAPDPLVTPFVLPCVLVVVALGAVALLPEPVARTMRPGLRPQRPEVPAEVRGVFALASAGVVASWSIAGLYLALAPSLAVILLHTGSHVAGGVSVFALGISAGLGQVALRGLAARQATAAGALGLAVGMAGTVASIPADSGPLFLAGSVITGAGFGVAFMGALRSVSAAAPAWQRAGVIAAFYVVAYLALSVPSVLAGLVVPGLRIEPTFRVFGIAVIVLALLTAAGTRRGPRATRTVQPATK
jgi:MFS family permease